MNHIRKRIMVIIAAVFICCTFIKGQIIYADEPSGEIEVLMTLSEYEMRPYLDEFEKKYPNVIVKYTYYQNYEEEVKKRMETGDYGDVLPFSKLCGSNEADKASYRCNSILYKL